MKSTSVLAIDWVKPDIEEEEWEFRHPAKQEFYLRHAVTWEVVRSRFDYGRLDPYPRSDRIGEVPVLLSYHTYDDYLANVARAKRGYRVDYTGMERDLQRKGNLTMKAPIVISCSGESLLYSGYRRLCLAWNHGIVPYVWIVSLQQERT
jgi:hypothetical protein